MFCICIIIIFFVFTYFFNSYLISTNALLSALADSLYYYI